MDPDHPETIDERYERNLRATRLSDQIDTLQRVVDSDMPRLVLHPAQVRLILDQLRELRARRIAAGRDPDDERNAAADMCRCGRAGPEWWSKAMAAGCPVHPERPEQYDGSTGREFVEAATEALGGGLTAEQAPGFCLGCGERDCCCPADGGLPF
jgi:hypothetical protein